MKTRILFLITLLCAAVASVQIVHAATFTVTNTGDNGGVNPAPGTGTGTLRQAIVDANATPGADTITFTVTGTILLASALPNLSDDVTINGPGANTLAVNGNAATRIFQIDGGVDVTIDGLTVMNGHVVTPSFGGGIFNNGTLTVTNSTLSGNAATGLGGGIYNTGTLTVTNSTISGNSATGSLGGGIFNGPGTLNLNNSIVANNTALSALDIFGIVSGDYNLVEDPSGAALSGTHNITGVDPMLGPLRDNGGPTLTHGLLAGSPAIDQGKNLSGATTHQRGVGFPRTVDDPSITNASGGDGTDIGSFEGVQPVVCPQPQGYWKNDPGAWPVSALPMTLGSQTYTQTELLTILGTPIGKGTKADASLILADQLMAAKLNIANGANGTPVTSTIADANTVLSLYPGKLPYRVRTNTTNGQRMVNDAATLESYNKGLLTPGCGPRHIYWTNDSAAGTVGRANVDGTGVNESFITGASSPEGVAVDSGHIYWSNFDLGSIGRANLDKTGVNQSFISGQPSEGVAVDSAHIYFANTSSGSIDRANLDGTGAQLLILQLGAVVDVAVDSSHIY